MLIVRRLLCSSGKCLPDFPVAFLVQYSVDESTYNRKLLGGVCPLCLLRGCGIRSCVFFKLYRSFLL